MNKVEKTAKFIREIFDTDGFIPLHEPKFIGNEKKYLSECIDSTFVSYLGEFVSRFEKDICDYTGAKYAITMSSGTAALHIALEALEVNETHEVITQAITFVATANAISYSNASPIFVDSNKEDLGMCPTKLEEFLNEHCEIRDYKCFNKTSGKQIKCCVPMHVFGHSVNIEKIIEVCNKYNIAVIEDSAESMGSYFKGKHTGTFGKIGIFSFNGNKTITCGGGGTLITDDQALAERVRHLSTTAKRPHSWEYFHDEVGYNYRMPNLNAAVGVAQMETLNTFLKNKRELAEAYQSFFSSEGISFLNETENRKSNFWLNAIILENKVERELFLKVLNNKKVMCRPIWTMMNKLPPFKKYQTSDLSNAQWLEDRVVNIPSGVRL